MKLIVALASIGAFCLSTVQALTIENKHPMNHKWDCDQACWDKFMEDALKSHAHAKIASHKPLKHKKTTHKLGLKHQNDWESPCEDDDDECWENLGAECDEEDNACYAQALGVPEDQMPDCQDGDQDCWDEFWNDAFSEDSHAKIIANHKGYNPLQPYWEDSRWGGHAKIASHKPLKHKAVEN